MTLKPAPLHLHNDIWIGHFSLPGGRRGDFTPCSLCHRYPVQNPELGCYGHEEFSRGVRNYGKRDPSELFDVYCFASDMQGEIHSTRCIYKLPAKKPRGLFANILESLLRPLKYIMEDTPASPEENTEAASSTHIPNGKASFSELFIYSSLGSSSPSEPPTYQPSNWTGQVDLDKEPGVAAEFPESSDEYVTVRLQVGDTSLDWSGQVDSVQDGELDVSSPGSGVTPESQGGSAKEEEDDEGLSGQAATMAASTTVATILPTTAQTKGRSPMNIMNSLWKPWNYLGSTEGEEQGTTRGPVTASMAGASSTVSSSEISSATTATASPSPEIPSAVPSTVPSEVSSAVPSTVPSELPSASPSNIPKGLGPAVTVGEEWAIVTEVFQQGRLNADLWNDTEVKHEEKRNESLEPEDDSTEIKEAEAEGSSFGELDLSEGIQTTLAPKTMTGLPSSPPTTTKSIVATTAQVDESTRAVEARGEIQYKRKNRHRRPGHRNQNATTTVVTPTTLAGSSEKEDETHTTQSPQVLTSASPTVGETKEVSTVALDQTQPSSFGILLPGNPESGHGNSETIRSNSSHGSEGTPSFCFCPVNFENVAFVIHVDDCLSNPCENGGTCIDKVDSFICLCLPSYSGDMCEKDTEGCEHGWKKFHGHCYRLFPRRHTWEDAEKDCREHSGHLTSVTSTMEQDFLNGSSHTTDPINSLMCGTPPAVENAYLVGRRRSHYDIHSVVRYQCADGFFQRHIPTARCRPNGSWERPKIVCTKCE
uniref:Neurocan b n=1 Tax=Astyanax mexicanus TaxID=7994 RepID=A0A8B9H8S4_ASTMX